MVRPEGWHRSDNGPIVLLSCRAGDHIAIKVYKGLELIQAEQGEKYGVPWVDLTPTVETHFASTSGKVVIGKREDPNASVRGLDVYIFQDVENHTIVPNRSNSEGQVHVDEDTNIGLLIDVVDAARRSDARSITVVTPSFPKARAHKRTSREGLSLTEYASRLEELGVNRTICVDIHHDGTPLAFRKTSFESIPTAPTVLRYIHDNLEVDIVGSLDTNAHRAELVARALKRPLGIIWKKRDYTQPNTVKEAKFLYDGETEGKSVLFVDDLLDTATTFETDMLHVVRQYGFREVNLMVGLGLFNGPAIERLDRLYDTHTQSGARYLERLIVSNGAHIRSEILAKPWLVQIPIEDVIADAIFRVHTGQSLVPIMTYPQF